MLRLEDAHQARASFQGPGNELGQPYHALAAVHQRRPENIPPRHRGAVTEITWQGVSGRLRRMLLPIGGINPTIYMSLLQRFFGVVSATGFGSHTKGEWDEK